MFYTFDKKNKGYIGDGLEMAIKTCLNLRNADRVSAQGQTDLRYNGKCYDVKQNGTVIQCGNAKAIKGSTRVIYATHVAHTVVAETTETITISINLAETDLYCVDRDEFVEFLRNHPKNLLKPNSKRNEINIQTVYNYTKNAYHGKKGLYIEEWLDENKLIDDTIIDDILDGYYASL
jgi:hypothetical protein